MPPGCPACGRARPAQVPGSSAPVSARPPAGRSSSADGRRRRVARRRPDSPVRLCSWGGGGSSGRRRSSAECDRRGRPQNEHQEDDVAMRREVNTVDELRAIVGHPNAVRRQQGRHAAGADPPGLAGAFAAGFRRDDRRRRPRRRVAQGRPARLRPRHRRHHDRDPGAAGQQARGRLPQRAAAPARRHAVPDPRPRGHVADQRNRARSSPTPTTSTR